MRKFIKTKGLKGLIFAILLSGIFFILVITNCFFGMNNFFMDRIYQKPSSINPNIFIIGIDEKSLGEEGLGNYNGWRREYYKKVIENISAYNPAVIGIDVLFTGESAHPEDDLALAEVCKDLNVVVGSNLVFGNTFDTNTFTTESTVTSVAYPYQALKNNVSCGYVNALLDADSVARKVIPIMEYNNQRYESFGYTIYKKYCEQKGIKLNDYNVNEALRINYTAMPQEGYTEVSFSDVYNGIVPSDIDENSIVLIGAYATGLQDRYLTPIKGGILVDGVEIHANIIDAYLKNDVLYDFNKIAAAFIVLIILFLLAYLIYKSKILIGSISSVLVIGLSILLQSVLYNAKIYYPFIDLILGALIVYVGYILTKYGEELYNRFQTVNVFKRYVAPQVVEKALKNVDYKVNVGGEKRHIACLFVDIRGFTPLSEGLEPEDVVGILNEYLTLTTNAVFSVGGTLDKFIGDATMAIFNAPFDLEDYMYKAVKCAWLIALGSEEIDRIAFERYGKHVSFGIGVNSGFAVVGNIGSNYRIDYTAIGDTVNTAARLEANAKAKEVLISEALYNEVKDRVEAECIGGLQLKGKSKEVITYRVLGLKEEI